MEAKPIIGILKVDGINCDAETAFITSIEKVGGIAKLVLMNQLYGEDKSVCLDELQGLIISGGFSYGDHIRSGKVLADELTIGLKDELPEFVHTKGKPILGICNGFQVLVQSGLLPFNTKEDGRATLYHNDIGHFRSDWITLKAEKGSRCLFTHGLSGRLEVMTAHAEGKFMVDDPNLLEKLEAQHQVVFRYVDKKGKPTQEYPDNPNGSMHAIAGVCNPEGNVLGMMPHPERFVYRYQHLDSHHRRNLNPWGVKLFKNFVEYAKGVA